MGQIGEARQGKTTPEMSRISKEEGMPVSEIMACLDKGTVVIPKNRGRTVQRPCGIGTGLKTKINANIGTSRDRCDKAVELQKVAIAEKAGADTIMDLSTGGDIDAIRKEIAAQCTIPVGTVPIYQTVIAALENGLSIGDITEEEIFRTIELQAEDGVDFMTLHCGVTRESFSRLQSEKRVMDVVSRGGAFMLEWMAANEKENPLYVRFDHVLDIAKKYDLTLSLGDGMRPGCIADAGDRAQYQELIILGELQQRALREGVQVMIEGPGHVPINKIRESIEMEKRICHGAPFYVLGPIVTDLAMGYDHISSAIGAAMASAAGADYICYVTPAEHVCLPSVEDVKEGVIASRIAAHAGDIAKGIPGAYEQDLELSKLRRQRNWEKMIKLSLDPEKAQAYRTASLPKEENVCTMCSEFCSIKIMDEIENQKLKTKNQKSGT